MSISAYDCSCCPFIWDSHIHVIVMYLTNQYLTWCDTKLLLTELLDQVLRWDQATIRPTLPLLTDHETSLTLHIQGASDFIAPACRKVTAPARWVRGGSRGHKVALESSDATVGFAYSVFLNYSMIWNSWELVFELPHRRLRCCFWSVIITSGLRMSFMSS